MNTLSVNLTNDLVFKAIFGKAGNEHLVLSLINAIRGDKNLPLVSEVELKSPVAAIQSLVEKHNVLDLYVRGDGALRYDIEVQVRRQGSYLSRVLYYLAGMHREQDLRGKAYDAVTPSVGIHILDESFFADAFPHRYATFRSDVEPMVDLSRDLLLHFIEMRKVLTPAQNGSILIQGSLTQWVYALYHAGEKEDSSMYELQHTKDEFADLADQYARFSADAETRAAIEAHERWSSDLAQQYNDGLKAGKAEGLERGLSEGARSAKLETALKLRAMGLSDADICTATGLSPEEIADL